MSDLLPDEQQLADAEAKMTPGPVAAYHSGEWWQITCGKLMLQEVGRFNYRTDAEGYAMLRNGIRPLLSRVARMRKALEDVIELYKEEGNAVGNFSEAAYLAREALKEAKP